nr:hypothetical protein [Mycoplasmopsis bovis]
MSSVVQFLPELWHDYKEYGKKWNWTIKAKWWEIQQKHFRATEMLFEPLKEVNQDMN